MADVATEENTEALEQFEGLKGLKNVLFDASIGEDEAANIMTNLNPEEVKALGTTMYEVQDIDRK